MTYETERLYFRPWKIEDAEELFSLAADEHVGPPCGWLPHICLDETKSILERILINDHTFCFIDKESGKIIGNIGIDDVHDSEMLERLKSESKEKASASNQSAPDSGSQSASDSGNQTGSDSGNQSAPDSGNQGKEPVLMERELGFWVGYPYWNQGYMTEAVIGTIDYCFDVLGLTRLWCGNFSDNPASGHVQEKCGFKYVYTRKEFSQQLGKEVEIITRSLERCDNE